MSALGSSLAFQTLQTMPMVWGLVPSSLQNIYTSYWNKKNCKPWAKKKLFIH